MPEQESDGFHAGRVALELGPMVESSPAPVAVHDDRDVARQVGRIDQGVVHLSDLGHGRFRLIDDVRPGRGVRRPGQRCSSH